MSRRTAAWWLATIALAASTASCSDDANQVAPVSFDSVAPPLTAAATTELVASSSTTAASTTVAVTTTEATTATTTSTAPSTSVAADGVTGPVFSDALGVKVSTAPGVHTRGDTHQLLPEGLYVHIAWEADPADPSVFTVQPDDVEILEAYANAVATFYRAAMTTLTTDAPEFDRYYVDGGALLDKAFATRRSNNAVLSLGAGVVLRPYVLVDQTTPDHAVVLDCYLQDEQEVLNGSEATLHDLLPRGQEVSLVRTDGVWKVDAASDEGRACV